MTYRNEIVEFDRDLNPGLQYRQTSFDLPVLHDGSSDIEEWFHDQVVDVVQRFFIELGELEVMTLERLQSERTQNGEIDHDF